MLLMGLPGNVFPEIVTFWDWLSPDKVVHLIVFGTLSFLILLGFREELETEKKYKYVFFAITTTVLYGTLTELLQAYVFTGRSGNVYDAMADTIGAVLGWLLYKPLLNGLKKIKVIQL
jgi:VanZ family protein